MKKELIYTALVASAALTLSSCSDKEDKAKEPTRQPATEQAPAAPAEPTAPTDEELSALISSELPAANEFEPGTLSCEPPAKAEDGSLALVIQQPMTVKENLYSRTEAPAAFNEQRKAMNDAANAATTPESVYLLQVGATTDRLTDADREPKALPEDLQTKANELKDLAESSVWEKQKSAGDSVNVTVRANARYEDGAWKLSNVTVDDSELQPLMELKPESTLTAEGAAIMSPDFENARKAEIDEKVAAFNSAAEAYINSREEAARQTVVKLQAQAEEAAHKANEEQAAADAEKKKWVDACAKALAKGKDFAGEWTRNNQFGELTLHIESAKQFDNSIQFIGTLYDTKLPEASLDIAGRCDLTPDEKGAKVDVSIYDGSYDPNQPTAEVYDARDGMLVLHLDANGKLSGNMTCAAWANTPEKAFNISLAPKAAAKPAAKESSKSKKR